MTSSTVVASAGPQVAARHVCRVTITGASRRADVTIPANVPIGELMPDLCELLAETTGPDRTSRTAIGRIGREPFHPDNTLDDEAVLDGEILMLVNHRDKPAPILIDDLVDVFTDSSEPPASDSAHAALGEAPRTTYTLALLLTTGIAAAATISTVLSSTSGNRHALAAVLGAFAIVSTCVGIVRARAEGIGPPVMAAACCAQIALCGAAVLSVGDPLSTPAMLTGSVAVLAGGGAGLRTGATPIREGSGAVVLSAVCAGAALAGEFSVPVTAIACVTALIGLMIWASAPRLALTLNSVAPPADLENATDAEPEPDSEWNARADRVRTTLHGIQVAAAIVVAVSTLLVVVHTAPHGGWGPPAFAACVAVTLAHWGRSYATRLAPLISAGGATVITMALVVTSAMHASHAHLVGLAAGILAVVAAVLATRPRTGWPSPPVHRVAEFIQLGAAIATFPLACWVGGALSLVRQV